MTYNKSRPQCTTHVAHCHPSANFLCCDELQRAGDELERALSELLSGWHYERHVDSAGICTVQTCVDAREALAHWIEATHDTG